MIKADISLKSIPCLADLDAKRLEQLEQKAHLKKIRKNELIFKEAEPVKSIFVVKSGLVKLSKTSAEGRELVIEIMERGDHFCFAPMYLGRNFSANAQAIEDSYVIMINAADFKSVIDSETGKLGQKIISGLCRKIEHLTRMIEDIAFNDIEQRISRAMLNLIDGRNQSENIVTIEISHKDIASMTGTVREVVSRTIGRLKKHGIIIKTGVRYLKINRKRLVSFLELENDNLLIKKAKALAYPLPECSKSYLES